MSDQSYVFALAVAGLCFLGVLVIAMVALFLGRDLRVDGRAKLGDQPDMASSVTVTGARKAPQSEQ
ncbi:MAG TPA: hypothetical protein VHP33_17580 [Polyangiaceae bacterium]|nr:hypothetical protein [Polyangiaceae bacterium]